MHIILLIGVLLIVLHLFVRERTMLINGQVGPWTRRIRGFNRWSPVVFFIVLAPLVAMVLYVFGSVVFALIF